MPIEKKFTQKDYESSKKTITSGYELLDSTVAVIMMGGDINRYDERSRKKISELYDVANKIAKR